MAAAAAAAAAESGLLREEGGCMFEEFLHAAIIALLGFTLRLFYKYIDNTRFGLRLRRYRAAA